MLNKRKTYIKREKETNKERKKERRKERKSNQELTK